MSGRDDALRAELRWIRERIEKTDGKDGWVTFKNITGAEACQWIDRVDATLAPTPDAAPASEAREDEDFAGAAVELRKIAKLIRNHSERDRLTRGCHHPEWHTGMRTAANHADARAEKLEVRAKRAAAPKPAAETGSTGADAARWRWLADIAFIGSSDIEFDLMEWARSLAFIHGADADAHADRYRLATPAQDAAHGGRHG